MVRLEIISEDKGLYELKKAKRPSPVYELLIEFYGIEKPSVGSIILMDERLLDEKYEGFSQPYSFEYYMEYVDDKAAPIEGTEHIVLFDNNKSIIMERIYG